ncbi:3-hydroxyacyl-ACP dehydratase FabZ [Peptostreptococcus equinus]|uniref:3-hydroxyacyl-[acyl-carrier-protein] dehydratase n=1 Tax=Peptostreptococcus equinus TaxID=3003601 RepID=A0ABY7JLR0_9FIRM|nr:3-hydroxyacyl-ACP dehydratase FabZ [Peptostreptococcus sp. CBA3647]WAW14289.1 3-hydroxyacyl-ACP dehydratase FabZ [Peptostreptococcus sp. CBA3647]
MLEIEEIEKIIPHRYPFLLIDKVIEMDIGKNIKAVKCVSANEEFFNGHFPKHKVMPGVLLIESIAQAGAVSILSMDEYKGKIAFFSGIKQAKFRREVRPGDKLDIEVEIIKLRKNYGIGKGKIFCQEEICVEAEISFFIN